METASGRPARSLPEAIARVLRHEVGDLLQTVYATTAILQKRLPAGAALERRVLIDMRARAEACKELLDTVHDLACPVSLATERVDLSELLATLARDVKAKHPQLEIKAEVGALPGITGDPRRLQQAAEQMLAHACASAQHRIEITARGDPGASVPSGVEWTITDDGSPLSPEELEKLFTPSAMTRQGRPGVGMALAQKLVHLHGGNVTGQNVAQGGLQIRVTLPVTPANTGQDQR